VSPHPIRSSRRHDDLLLHERMKAAEIVEGSRLVEDEAKFVLGVERRGTELVVLATTLCGMSSSFSQTIVVPTGTVIVSPLE
jgi:hypothetical protein